MLTQFVKLKDVKTPEYGTQGSAGIDFYLPGEYSVTLQPGLNKIDLGIAVSVPEGHVLLLKGKSGVTMKHELIIMAGVIDSDYTGEISVLCFYPKAKPAKLLAGSKVVQGIFLPIEQAAMVETGQLQETIRGDGGFGSTGE